MNTPLLLSFLAFMSIAMFAVGVYWGTRPKRRMIVATAPVLSAEGSEETLMDWVRRYRKNETEDDDVLLLLKQSGNPKGWTIQDFKAAKTQSIVLYGFGGAAVVLVVMLLTAMWSLAIIAIPVAIFGAWFGMGQPKRGLIGKSKKRQQQVTLQLPSLLVSIALADGAGYTPEAAVKVATEELAQGTLKGEMEIMLQLLATGSSFAAALANFRERIPTRIVEEFTQKLYDGAVTGMPLASSMTELAETAFIERQQALEIAGKKASQKIMFIVVPACMLVPDIVALLYPIMGAISGAGAAGGGLGT